MIFGVTSRSCSYFFPLNPSPLTPSGRASYASPWLMDDSIDYSVGGLLWTSPYPWRSTLQSRKRE